MPNASEKAAAKNPALYKLLLAAGYAKFADINGTKNPHKIHGPGLSNLVAGRVPPESDLIGKAAKILKTTEAAIRATQRNVPPSRNASAKNDPESWVKTSPLPLFKLVEELRVANATLDLFRQGKLARNHPKLPLFAKVLQQPLTRVIASQHGRPYDDGQLARLAKRMNAELAQPRHRYNGNNRSNGNGAAEESGASNGSTRQFHAVRLDGQPYGSPRNSEFERQRSRELYAARAERNGRSTRTDLVHVPAGPVRSLVTQPLPDQADNGAPDEINPILLAHTLGGIEARLEQVAAREGIPAGLLAHRLGSALSRRQGR